jgi:hypothetical protein
VLERMFFIQCLLEPQEFVSEPEVAAQLTFEGDPSGELTLRITAGAARSVSADFLGAGESDLSEQEIGEVVCELANMICGSVLSRVESSSTFRLATPRILVPPAESDGCTEVPPGSFPPSREDGQVPAIHAVEMGSGRMVVSITTEAATWSTVPKFAF